MVLRSTQDALKGRDLDHHAFHSFFYPRRTYFQSYSDVLDHEQKLALFLEVQVALESETEANCLCVGNVGRLLLGRFEVSLDRCH